MGFPPAAQPQVPVTSLPCSPSGVLARGTGGPPKDSASGDSTVQPLNCVVGVGWGAQRGPSNLGTASLLCPAELLMETTVLLFMTSVYAVITEKKYMWNKT